MAKAKKNIYVRMIYEEGEDHWDDTYGPFSAEEAQVQADCLKEELKNAISQGCAEVSFIVDGNYRWSL